MAYLRYCLDEGKNPVVALAMYNAGRTRVTERGTPRMTLDYISRILDYQRDLEGSFENGLISKQQLVKT